MNPAAWRLLSLALAPPTRERLESIAGLAEAIGLPELAAEADGADLGEATSDWEALFGVEGALPPYESAFYADPFRAARELADISGFYLAFGAESSGPAGERADHAGTELEFLTFLGLRRLLVEGEEAETCRHAEDAFLADHAGRWLPGLFAAVADAAATDLYRTLSLDGGRLLACELESRGLSPQPLRRRRRLALVETDSISCGGD